jgi:hypothetical protein
MKNKTKYILLSICLIGNYSAAKSMPTVRLLTIAHSQSVTISNSLGIIGDLSTVKRGGTGVIIIHGTPKTQYTIRTSYKLGNKVVPVMQLRTTDKTGVATFNWIVSMETIPGTYDVSISGDGNTIRTTHVVLP